VATILTEALASELTGKSPLHRGVPSQHRHHANRVDREWGRPTIARQPPGPQSPHPARQVPIHTGGSWERDGTRQYSTVWLELYRPALAPVGIGSRTTPASRWLQTRTGHVCLNPGRSGGFLGLCEGCYSIYNQGRLLVDSYTLGDSEHGGFLYGGDYRG
jgi:hypothetical protein